MMQAEHSTTIINDDEPADVEQRGRSKGKKRTAREVAQMFEQLKQHHIARKKEWQIEREELMKRAATAEESKKILVDLKKILEDLRTELRTEERKRTEAQAETDKMKTLWEQEKNELLEVIEQLENQNTSELHRDQACIEKINAISTQLSAREHDLQEARMVNANLRRMSSEQQELFDDEKRKIIECHEGERKNWIKAKQVMLDKIQTLQEECRSLRSSIFPLHGRHVTSPVVDNQSPPSTSSILVGRSSVDKERLTLDCFSSTPESGVTEDPETKRNDFRKTVDEALKQIEKISKDLNKLDTETAPNGKEMQVRFTPTSASDSDVMNSASRIQKVLLNEEKDKKNPTKAFAKIDLTSDQVNVTVRDLTGRNPTTSPPSEESLVSSKSENPILCGSVVTASSPQYSNTAQSTSPANMRETSSNLNLHLRESSSGDHVAGSTLLTSSPVNSSTTSCSVTNFTESGTDSAPLLDVQSYRERRLPEAGKTSSAKYMKTPIVTATSGSHVQREGKSGEFLKTEKKYALPNSNRTDKSARNSVSAKKLPTLHQKLLFRNPSEIEVKKVDTYSKQKPENAPMKALKEGTNNKPKLQKLTKTLNESDENVARHAMRSQERLRPGKHSSVLTNQQEQHLGAPKNLPENIIAHSKDLHKDFVEAVEKDDKTPSTTLPYALEGPPVRPKPSVTIEKDASGNVLRVITDPRYQMQHSPNPSPTSLSLTSSPNQSRTTNRFMHGSKTTGRGPCSNPSGEEDTKDFATPFELKPGIGKLGKDWIKKKLPFLDSSSKGVCESKQNKTRDLVNSQSQIRSEKSRSSSRKTQKVRGNLERSTSDESLDETNRSLGVVRTKRNVKKAALDSSADKAKGSKARLKRYTRSKTDSPLEMKNLFSKFRQSQFNQKKPSIVKQFEKKLFENEIKTLQEHSENCDQSKFGEEAPKLEVPETDDDGYSGEDELDIEGSYQRKGGIETRGKIDCIKTNLTKPSGSLRTAETIFLIPRDSQQFSPADVVSKPSHHKSMTDIRCSNGQKQELSLKNKGKKVEPSDLSLHSLPQHKKLPSTRKNNSKMTVDLTAVTEQFRDQGLSPESEENQTVSDLVGKFNKAGSVPPEDSFVRRGPGRYSLTQENLDRYRRSTEASSLVKPDSGPERRGQSKRLSWAEPLREIEVKGVTWRDKIFAPSNSPPNDPGDSNEQRENITTLSSPRRKMSEEILKKKQNLERVLNREPKKPLLRRYRRSETQPLTKNSYDTSSDESSDVDEFARPNATEEGSLKKANSMQNMGIDSSGNDDAAPSLTPRFKKPLINKRRPARWRKRDEDEKH